MTMTNLDQEGDRTGRRWIDFLHTIKTAGKWLWEAPQALRNEWHRTDPYAVKANPHEMKIIIKVGPIQKSVTAFLIIMNIIMILGPVAFMMSNRDEIEAFNRSQHKLMMTQAAEEVASIKP